MEIKTKNSYNILLVDSNQDVYQLLEKVLSEIEDSDFNIEWICDYGDAIKAIHNGQHDLVFVDYQLDTTHTGMDLLQEVNVTQKDVPFIMLTNQENQNVDQEAIQLGVADFLKKDQLNKSFIERSIRYSIERQRLINQINQLAHFDALTDLPNRLSFDKALKRYVASAVRYERKSALMVINLNQFKAFNKKYGKDVGDLALQETSQRIRSGIRDSDYAARIDADRFAVILNEIENSHAAGVTAQNLCEKIGESMHINHQDMVVTANIGIVCFPNETKTGMDLMHCADVALNRITDQFHDNSYQFYRREIHEEHSRRLSVERLLPQCIENDELYLTYQPIFDLAENKIIGMEALIRWHCQTLNQDMPLDEFLPLAEETGLIHKIGKWVLKEASAQLHIWQEHGYDGFLTINISPEQLFKTEFTDYLINEFSQLKNNFRQIKIEIHEPTLMYQDLAVEDRLEKLKDLGLDIFIDRFGNGCCSLKQISELNIHTIKIDKELIKNSGELDGERIIKAILALAKSLSLNVIAEGIETNEQKQALIAWGCYQGQGYFYSKPLIVSQMTQYLKSRKKIDPQAL